MVGRHQNLNPESKTSLNHAKLKPRSALNHAKLNPRLFVDLLQNELGDCNAIRGVCEICELSALECRMLPGVTPRCLLNRPLLRRPMPGPMPTSRCDMYTDCVSQRVVNSVCVTVQLSEIACRVRLSGRKLSVREHKVSLRVA